MIEFPDLTPFVMVSGMSLFLLVLTNRFATLTARVREYLASKTIESPTNMLYRIEVLRVAIFLATISVICALVAVATEPLGPRLMTVLVYASTFAAIASTVAFLLDIVQAAKITKAMLRSALSEEE
ncbi:MAG: DUF2721 domain-containing protein [Bacteroidetes bacterium]|nr:DUF2721 domain-containing protein [Bacteroidota bacterium]